MRFLGILLTLAGYTLVYASIAASGQFALNPWQGLFGDAYQAQAAANEAATGGNSSGGGSGSTSKKSKGTNWLKELIPGLYPLPGVPSGLEPQNIPGELGSLGGALGL